MVGQSRMVRNRYVRTGSTHRIEVRRMVSHTLLWFRVFLAVP